MRHSPISTPPNRISRLSFSQMCHTNVRYKRQSPCPQAYDIVSSTSETVPRVLVSVCGPLMYDSARHVPSPCTFRLLHLAPYPLCAPQKARPDVAFREESATRKRGSRTCELPPAAMSKVGTRPCQSKIGLLRYITYVRSYGTPCLQRVFAIMHEATDPSAV